MSAIESVIQGHRMVARGLGGDDVDELRIADQAAAELKQMREALARAWGRLVESRFYVNAMVGVASGARGLPEKIDETLALIDAALAHDPQLTEQVDSAAALEGRTNG